MAPFWEHVRLTCGSVVAVVETSNVTVSPRLGRPFPLMSVYITSVRLELLFPFLPPPLPAEAPATRAAAVSDPEGAIGDAEFARSLELAQFTLIPATNT